MDIISTSTRRTTSPNFTHWAGLAAELVPPFEEHLVICAQCQDTLRKKILSRRVTELLRSNR